MHNILAIFRVLLGFKFEYKKIDIFEHQLRKHRDNVSDKLSNPFVSEKFYGCAGIAQRC